MSGTRSDRRKQLEAQAQRALTDMNPIEGATVEHIAATDLEWEADGQVRVTTIEREGAIFEAAIVPNPNGSCAWIVNQVGQPTVEIGRGAEGTVDDAQAKVLAVINDRLDALAAPFFDQLREVDAALAEANDTSRPAPLGMVEDRTPAQLEADGDLQEQDQSHADETLTPAEIAGAQPREDIANAFSSSMKRGRPTDA
jgi:hypothetical protein